MMEACEKMEASLTLRPLDLVVMADVSSVLKLIQKNSGFATLAGGYLRDSYYRVNPKDLDVFVASSDRLKVCKVLEDNGWLGGDEGMDDDDEYKGKKHICDVFNFTKAGYLPLQIICSDEYTNISKVLNTFDFGFCQIAYDGDTVLVTDAFWKDAVDNSATLIRTTSNGVARMERLKTKYPNVKWILPEAVDEL